MCGFCGVVGPAAAGFTDDVEAMAGELRHRGPDDSGTWRKSFRVAGADHEVALGHTRLSILDLSPLGHQPMSLPDGSATLAYNGEIYNFRELREELSARGAEFRSDSDTEVLLHAYRVWGVDALERLNGMFAFALWDAARQRLLLARDRLGIKPLYYHHRPEDGLLLFGSELRALRRHRAFRPEIDRGALARYLRLGTVTGHESIYRNTRSLRPGSLLIWEGGKIEVRSWWSLCDPSPPEAPADLSSAVDVLESLLGDAVEQRLVADVPLGAFLSGGIDSSCIVSLMRERATGAVRTFSIGFREPEYDEAPYARRIAEHLGTDHTELIVDREQAVSVAHELADLYDEPFADSSAIPTTLLSRMTRKSVTVALSGDGGDELFGGYDRYPRYARLLSLLGLPAPVPRLLAAMAPLAPVGSWRRGFGYLRPGTALGVAEAMRTHFSPGAIAAAFGPEAAEPPPLFRSTFLAAPGDDGLVRMMHADAASYLPDDILTKVDRASMSVALEVRVPMLDHRVVRFALGLPREIFWHGGRSKAPLREILYRRMPRELIERPKRGFGIPIRTLLAEELGEWKRRYLAPDRIEEEGHFDPEGLRRLVAEAEHGPEPTATARLWYLLCFQRWFARTHRGERDA